MDHHQYAVEGSLCAIFNKGKIVLIDGDIGLALLLYGPICSFYKDGVGVVAIAVDNLGDLLRGFDHVLVPEMNTGQFKTVLRDQYLIDAQPLTKTSGQPFQIAELEAEIAKFFDGVPGNEGGQVPANDQQLPSTEGGAE